MSYVYILNEHLLGGLCAGCCKEVFMVGDFLNPILHTVWLESHALTLKNNTAKYYFSEKSSFLHTFLKFFPETRTICMAELPSPI